MKRNFALKRSLMAARILFAALFTMLTFVEVAHADTFAAGPVYGGTPSFSPLAGAVTVRVFNAGSTPVTFDLTQIFTNTNFSIALSSNTCLTGGPNPPLGPNQYCAFTGPILGNFAFSCRLNALGSETDLRGVCEVKSSNNVILSVEPLEKSAQPQGQQ